MFAMDLINPKAFTLRYVEHGIKYELIALQEYEKIMFARKARVKVLKSGFVVCLETVKESCLLYSKWCDFIVYCYVPE